MPSLDNRAKLIFDEAIELHGPARSAYLVEACANDTDLRSRVEALLAAAEVDDVFLSDPTAGFDAPRVTPLAPPQQPTRIGPYRILELIGEGGFGSVYMAEQTEPVRRKVAVKILKAGMDTRAVVARFEQERQALALMDHPNIAKVFDAGATDTGRPYFVMELVKGEPITEFCDRESLSIPQRLELFAQVCRAVQHAHTKGVIHRDIKPTNILASEQDGRPFCKIIDFGIAKATQQPLTEKTIFTEFRQLVGTPEYMSPEQAAGSLDIDTRTDVYSLGVLLYELLTGSPPFDSRRLRSAAFDEMQRIIREVDPPTPSTRVSRSVDTLASIAAQRKTEPRKLGATIRGELDWIVMKALEKDRSRRYGSPGEFVADVDRFLGGQPIQAAPVSMSYRVRKFTARHRFGVISAALIALSLIVGIAAALWQARVASRERDAARKSAAEALSAKNDADERRREIEKVAEFQAVQLKDIDTAEMGRRLREALITDAREGMGRSGLSAAEIIKRQKELARLLDDVNPTNVALKALDETIFTRALKAVEEQFRDQPIVKARLLVTLGETLTALGLTERAAAPFNEGLVIRRKMLGNEHPDTLTAIDGFGELLYAQGKLPEAEAAFREALAGRRKILGESDRRTIESGSNLGSILQFEGKMAEAEPYYRATVENGRKYLGENDPSTLLGMNNLGHFLARQRKLSEAETITRDALERMRKSLPPDHTHTMFALVTLASILEDQGRLAEAEPLFREALERRRRVLGEDHIDTLNTIMDLGSVLRDEKKFAEAEPYYREALERRRIVLGVDHPDTLSSLHNMGALMGSEQRYPEAETYLSEAVERRKRVLGESNPGTLWSMHMLGRTLLAQKKPADAEPLLRKSLAGLESGFGKKYDRVAEAHAALGNALVGLARFEEAEGHLLSAEGVFASAEGISPNRYQVILKDIINLYESWEKADPGKGHGAKAAPWRIKMESATSRPVSSKTGS